MQVKKSLLAVVFSLFLIPSFGWASEAQAETPGEEKSLKEEISEGIEHHLMDSYDFHLFSDKASGAHYGFPLPVILFDDGLHVFMSSRFHHGESVAESNGKYYMIYHGKIYNTDAEGTMEMVDGHPHNHKPLDFPLPKTYFSLSLFPC